MSRLLVLLDSIRSSYWFLPAILAVGAAVLATVLVRIDESVQREAVQEMGWLYTGGAEGARAMLSAIGGSIITVAATTFSITIAALSMASGQFGSRVLRSFMRDRGNQIVLGTFTATFLYCLLVLRTVRGLDESIFVPHVAITGGVVLAVINVFVLIYFIHHVARTMQVSNVIEVLGHELDAAVERLFPERESQPSDSPHQPVGFKTVVLAEGQGYVIAIGLKEIIEHAKHRNAVVDLHVRPGDYLFLGSELATVWPQADEEFADKLRGSVATGAHRTSHQDAEFAFLQVAEIGVRALSPGINDPFTATMCIDRISAAIMRLNTRRLPDTHRDDSSGTLRLIARAYTYRDLVRAGFRMILENARNHPTVLRHLESRLSDLVASAHEPALRSALDEVRREIKL